VESGQVQKGEDYLSPLQIRQLSDEVSQVEHLFSQSRQFSEVKSSYLESGHEQVGADYLSPLQTRQLSDEVSHVIQTKSQS
jgi:hypothetical protein